MVYRFRYIAPHNSQDLIVTATVRQSLRTELFDIQP